MNLPVDAEKSMIIRIKGALLVGLTFKFAVDFPEERLSVPPNGQRCVRHLHGHFLRQILEKRSIGDFTIPAYMWFGW